MTETTRRMQQRHETEVEALQADCPHLRKSRWMDVMWAPGHMTGERIRECLRCGAILDQRPSSPPKPAHPLTEREMDKLMREM